MYAAFEGYARHEHEPEFVTVEQLRSELERVGGSVRDAVDEVVGALLAK